MHTTLARGPHRRWACSMSKPKTVPTAISTLHVDPVMLPADFTLLCTQALILNYAPTMVEPHCRPLLPNQISQNLLQSQDGGLRNTGPCLVTWHLPAMQQSTESFLAKPSRGLVLQRFCSISQANTPREAGLSLLRGKHLLLPRSLSTNHQQKWWQQLQDWSSPQEGQLCQPGNVSQTKRKEVRTVLPFKPATLPRSVHGSPSMMGKTLQFPAPRSSTV